MLEKKKSESRSFGWVILKVAEEMGISEILVSPTVPQWLLPQPTVDTSLLEKRDKDQGDRYNAQMVLMYIHSNYFCYFSYSDAC